MTNDADWGIVLYNSEGQYSSLFAFDAFSQFNPTQQVSNFQILHLALQPFCFLPFLRFLSCLSFYDHSKSHPLTTPLPIKSTAPPSENTFTDPFCCAGM